MILKGEERQELTWKRKCRHGLVGLLHDGHSEIKQERPDLGEIGMAVDCEDQHKSANARHGRRPDPGTPRGG